MSPQTDHDMNAGFGMYGYDRPAELYDPEEQPEYFSGVMWRRIFAFIIDLVVIAILVLLALVPFLVLTILSFGLFLFVAAGFFVALILGYEAFTLGGPYSSTYGMRMMGLEMRTWYGERPGILQAAAHSLLFYFSVTATTFLILLVPVFNGRRRCVHDFICGTVVINNAERRADLI